VPRLIHLNDPSGIGHDVDMPQPATRVVDLEPFEAAETVYVEYREILLTEDKAVAGARFANSDVVTRGIDDVVNGRGGVALLEPGAGRRPPVGSGSL
jgi:hypothetical protein